MGGSSVGTGGGGTCPRFLKATVKSSILTIGAPPPVYNLRLLCPQILMPTPAYAEVYVFKNRRDQWSKIKFYNNLKKKWGGGHSPLPGSYEQTLMFGAYCPVCYWGWLTVRLQCRVRPRGCASRVQRAPCTMAACSKRVWRA